MKPGGQRNEGSLVCEGGRSAFAADEVDIVRSSVGASFRRLLRDWGCIAVFGAGLLDATSAEPSATPHWAFQPVRPPAAPAVTNTVWCRTSVDPFILAPLERAGRGPVSEADPRTLIRRVTFDLTGLPPTAEEVDAFVRECSEVANLENRKAGKQADGIAQSASGFPAFQIQGAAYARLVDRLLASPAYGEHWGRHWLDVVRYADTAGETADYPVPVAWRYRNWVINAFNADQPFDEFLRDQIAGDILAKHGPRERYADRVTATGFLAVSRRFGFDSENYHHLTIQDTIDTVGQGVLGLTLGCARCHTHKYDPVPLTDYYALYGIFDSTRYAFPGSEQKQKSRALVPLIPREESQPRWREFEQRVAGLMRRMERAKLSAPSAVLRSLDELDGDFELQAPAAGGSKGVLVPPWVYDGPIAVTTDAQSPFKNLYPLGKVGAGVAAGTNGYWVRQAVPFSNPGGAEVMRLTSASGEQRLLTSFPAVGGRKPDMLYASVDFRIGAGGTNGAPHRFWLGAPDGTVVAEVLLTGEAATLRLGESVQHLRDLRPNEWYQLQLRLGLTRGTLAGSLGRPGDVTAFDRQVLRGGWMTGVSGFGLEAGGWDGNPHAGIAFDNLAVQALAIPPVSTESVGLATQDGSDANALAAQLQQLSGIDGDFELQTDATPPATPWGPGPNSVVKIAAAAQSPFHNLFPAGAVGVRLPNSGAYNGFGQTLTNRWQAGKTERLFVSFDFRVADATAGGDGSWRFYAGHGPGSSPAVELFFNGREFFRRSGDARDPVKSLKVGEWHQVQLALDLKARRYTGVLATATERTAFEGQFASNWDGSLDYTFIDSYGHLGGVKPALDADNFAFSETPLPAADSPPVSVETSDREARRLRLAALRDQQARIKAEAEAARRELETLLAEGPFPLTYGVTEGTPRDARIQKRGEPDQPGDEVRRGFLRVLGGGPLPAGTGGSGRLELADWLASPDNPLTARVFVNRVWQYHFGQGLVKTPNDFGTRGQRPTHPELLDHLATEFVRHGWSIKGLHRLILNSAAYRQRSQYSVISGQSSVGSAPDDCPIIPGTTRAAGLNTDSLTTDHFSPFARRRLGAEETRDALLFVSGGLDATPGEGHPFPAPTGWGYTQHGPFSAVYEHNRRSVYLMTQRIKRHPFLALFDGADPNASTAERRTTTVPTQALFFLNDPFVHASAEQFARRVLAVAEAEPDRIVAAYRLALGRSPEPVEAREATAFLARYRQALPADVPTTAAWAAFARVLFGSNEFLTVD